MHAVVLKPVELPYRPALQLVQAPTPPRLYFPATHTAAVAFTEPAAQKYPAAHGPVHNDDDRPVVAPYRPATHDPLQPVVFSFAVDPYSPALQFVHDPEPAREYVPG